MRVRVRVWRSQFEIRVKGWGQYICVYVKAGDPNAVVRERESQHCSGGTMRKGMHGLCPPMPVLEDLKPGRLPISHHFQCVRKAGRG